jgi:hypothetical protein
MQGADARNSAEATPGGSHSDEYGEVSMSSSTRRNFLIASGAAGVAAAVSSTAHAATARTGPAAPESVAVAPGAKPMVAHIGDPSSGKLSLLVGDHEIEVTDPDLIGRITRAAAKGA